MITHIAKPESPTAPDIRSIETQRLSLTALRPSDLDAFTKLFGEAHTARMTHAVPHPLSAETASELLASMMAGSSAWAIRSGDEDLIGVISLTSTTCGKPPGMDTFGPNLSVFVASEHRGRGYAVEAIDGLLDWVKRKRLHRIVHAAHFVDNLASARTLVAADFLYTGRRTMETSAARPGEHQALHMIRIL